MWEYTGEEEEYARIKAGVDMSLSGQIRTWEEVSFSLEQAQCLFQTAS